MDFTREPIIETVITPKEGCKLVVRSSKSAAQEEYFVDALEVVSFGNQMFFRSLERPKAFLVPTSDYEVLEVREARMVLKNVGLDRSIKIGGGREANMRPPKEAAPEKVEQVVEEPAVAAESTGRTDKKRDRRRHSRRRRGRDDEAVKEGEAAEETADERIEEGRVELPAPSHPGEEGPVAAPLSSPPNVIPSLLPPPSTLISETIAKYKDNALFKGAFYSKEEAKPEEEAEDQVEEAESSAIPLEQPQYGSFEMSEEEEEEIFRKRRQALMQAQEETAEPFSPPAESNGSNS